MPRPAASPRTCWPPADRDLVFPLTQSYVSDVLLVGDKAIRQAQHALWRSTRLITEPAAALTSAALITGAYRPAPGERVAIVITSANTTLSDFQAPAATEPGQPSRVVTAEPKCADGLTDEQVLILSDILPTGYVGAEMCDEAVAGAHPAWRDRPGADHHAPAAA